MKRTLAFCSFMSLFVWTGAACAADDGPSDKVPELKALDHYVGSWDVEITSKNLPFTKGQATAKWILDGRFVQQTSVGQSADGTIVAKLTTILTYDEGKKRYRSWSFHSNGEAIESEGTWNANAKTMTFVSRKDENEISSTTTADFAEAGVEKWKIVVTDGAGNAVREFSGKNTRKTK